MVLARIAALIEHEFTPGSLYTMFDAGKPTGSPVDRWNRVGSPLGRLPGGIRFRRWLMPLYPWAVGWLGERLDRDHARTPIDLLVSTSSAAIKGMRAPARADGAPIPHLCYCHSPARYVWSVRSEYQGGGRLSSAALALYAPAFKRWDRRTSAHVSQFIANSTHTAALIREAFGRESVVVFPPVRTAYFTPDASVARRERWLVVAALEPYKRVDLAIRAAGRARHPLTIAGEGSMRRALEDLAAEIAPGLVTFEGRVSDERLRDLYRSARMLLFPQIEDFGIIAAEALACGTPIAARRAGGAIDIIEDGTTGALFAPPHSPTPSAASRTVSHPPTSAREREDRSEARMVDALLEAIGRVPEPSRTTSEACVLSAARFSEERFDQQMRAQIRACLSVRRGSA